MTQLRHNLFRVDAPVMYVSPRQEHPTCMYDNNASSKKEYRLEITSHAAVLPLVTCEKSRDYSEVRAVDSRLLSQSQKMSFPRTKSRR